MVKGCEENPGDYEDVVEVIAEWETLAFSDFAHPEVFDEWYDQLVYIAEG
jgi:hypothetical protein